MRRGYSQEAFLALVNKCRELIPDVSLSTDVIAGFCGETEEEHQETLKVMQQVGFDTAYMFAYSLRDRTHAAHTMVDDVPEEVKQRRLRDIIDTYHEGTSYPFLLAKLPISLPACKYTGIMKRNLQIEVGKYRLVLVEGPAKQTEDGIFFTGRTDGNKRVVFPLPKDCYIYPTMEAYISSRQQSPILSLTSKTEHKHQDILDAHTAFQASITPQSPSLHRITKSADMYGSYIVVKILKANGPTLRGVAIARSSLQDFQA